MSPSSLESSSTQKGLYLELWYVISSLSIETNPGCRKREHGSNFISGNDNKLVNPLLKIIIFYVHVMLLTL